MRTQAKPLVAAVLAAGIVSACGASADSEAGQWTLVATEAVTIEATPIQQGQESPANQASPWPLLLGTVLPSRGPNAQIGAAELAGVRLAVADINESGGVGGQDLGLLIGEAGEPTDIIAKQSAEAQIAAGVDAIIGGASSAVTLDIIKPVTDAGVLLLSPSATSAALTNYPAGGLFFRTVPSDVAQAQVLANLAGTNAQACLFAVDDIYGQSMVASLTRDITNQGGEITYADFFTADSTSFPATAAECASTQPSTVVVIGYAPARDLLQSLIDAKLGPAQVNFLVSDGLVNNRTSAGVNGIGLIGARGTLPGGESSPEFLKRLQQQSPELTDFAYAAEAYDGVVLIALAAFAANSPDSSAIASHIPMISGASLDAVECRSFSVCRDLLSARQKINYQGESGTVDMHLNGEVTVADIGIYRYE